MAAFGQTNILQQTASSDLPLPARLAAIEAWSALRPAEAAETASAILSQIKNPQEASPIFGAFIGRDNGPSLLAAALEDKELESTVAAAGIELARESGRDLNKLEETLIRAGSLQPLPAKLSPDQRATLLKEVAQRGVAARGERIYRRDALACTKCHALSGTGGQLGPDLGSLGASMTPESILESLLNPNTTIKQGYETRIIRKKDDLIVSGTLQRKTDRSILLRTPTGIVTIPLNDIEAVQSSPISLMPAGLTQSLRRDELVDLLRFLTALGKEKGFKPEKRSGGLNP
jgi:putative heme-binding domain-containing protein